MRKIESGSVGESLLHIGLATLASGLLVVGRMESPPQVYKNVPDAYTTFQLNLQGGNFGWINAHHLYAVFKTGCLPGIAVHHGKTELEMFVMGNMVEISKPQNTLEINYISNVQTRRWEPKLTSLSEPLSCYIESKFSPISAVLMAGKLEQRFYGTTRILTSLTRN